MTSAGARKKSRSIVYFYESAFTMWRRRLAGIYAVARQEGWHVESVNVDFLESGVDSVLSYWKPDGVIVEGGALRHPGCEAARFAGENTEADAALDGYIDADEISGWAAADMKWALSREIYVGQNSRLLPKSDASRAVVAMMMYGYAK